MIINWWSEGKWKSNHDKNNLGKVEGNWEKVEGKETMRMIKWRSEGK